MPNCPNCGLLVDETDVFCKYCGTAQNRKSVSYDRGPVTDYPFLPTSKFVNGFIIGICAAVMILGSLLIWSLNADYWAQWNLLLALGTTPHSAASMLSDKVIVIAFCSEAVIVAAYFLIYLTLYQFNSTGRAIILQSDKKARLANGLMGGGLTFIALNMIGVTFNLYDPSKPNPWLYEDAFVIAGIILIVTGALLLSRFYFNSRRLATKV